MSSTKGLGLDTEGLSTHKSKRIPAFRLDPSPCLSWTGREWCHSPPSRAAPRKHQSTQSTIIPVCSSLFRCVRPNMDDCEAEAILTCVRFSLTAWPNYPGESGTMWDSKCGEVYRDNGNVKSTRVVTPVDSIARLFLVLVFGCIHRVSFTRLCRSSCERCGRLCGHWGLESRFPVWRLRRSTYQWRFRVCKQCVEWRTSVTRR
jgi:hypothetical protein